jgi:carbamoyl-phosphate synthase large subunit
MHQPLDADTLRDAKQLGFSDSQIGTLTRTPHEAVRALRKEHGIVPHLAQIDTLAAEFPAETNYLYATYHAECDDIDPSWRKKIMVLGSGAYRIGSSVEFDWCCVNAVQAASELGYETIMLNYNPETVSTDYDMCDTLIFDEISFETVMDIVERERPFGVVVSMGGQVPNNLTAAAPERVPILGEQREHNRGGGPQVSALLDDSASSHDGRTSPTSRTRKARRQPGRFPCSCARLCAIGRRDERRPRAGELRRILDRARSRPTIRRLEVRNSRSRDEIDAVADQGDRPGAISEHIRTPACRGDATLVLPPQMLYVSTIRRIKKIAADVARALEITGPVNMQFLAKLDMVKVIECNLRASRSFPFVSKATGTNYIVEAMRRMLGVRHPVDNRGLERDFVAVKAPMFSFWRLVGADPMLGVEMSSTGEVGCFGDDQHEALLHALVATGFRFPNRGVLLSLGPLQDKYWFAEEARVIAEELKLPIYATPGTAELHGLGIPATRHDGPDSAMRAIEENRSGDQRRQ